MCYVLNFWYIVESWRDFIVCVCVHDDAIFEVKVTITQNPKSEDVFLTAEVELDH